MDLLWFYYSFAIKDSKTRTQPLPQDLLWQLRSPGVPWGPLGPGRGIGIFLSHKHHLRHDIISIIIIIAIITL